MLQQTSQGFRKFFLEQFAIELIRSTIQQGKKEIKEDVKIQLELETPKTPKDLKAELEKPLPNFQDKTQTKAKIPIKKRLSLLRIPEPRLPMRLQYLKPTPTKEEIDIGKLNPLVKDPAVKIIECHGHDEPIIVRGQMGTKPTSIVLKKDEIEEIIQKFSETAKIPIQEGVSRIAVGNLVLSSINSKIISSKFIINKMSYVQGHPHYRR